MSSKSNFMAIDQYGHTYHNLGQHPRKELMERIGCRHVSKMYHDKKDGNGSRSVIHVGYVVGQHWCTLYEVKPYEGRVHNND
jgi:hypothetical protein